MRQLLQDAKFFDVPRNMLDPRVGVKEITVNGIACEFLYPLFKPVQVPSVLYLPGGGHAFSNPGSFRTIA